MNFHVDGRVTFEAVDDGLLVLLPGAPEVHHLQGAEAEAFVLAARGIDAVPAALEHAMAGLVALGIVRSDEWSRRKVLQLGGASAAAAIAVIALPSVAAAASVTTTIPTPTTVDIEYLVVGGGGSGGNGSNYRQGGGGGGAGGVLTGTAVSIGAGTYTVTVGGGAPSYYNSGVQTLHGAPSTLGFTSPITAHGGGRGGMYQDATYHGVGFDGASGGGGAGGQYYLAPNGPIVGGNATPSGEGHLGGSGHATPSQHNGGGGGGAAAAGGSAALLAGGNGGAGIASPFAGITGPVAVGGGGGGGRFGFGSANTGSGLSGAGGYGGGAAGLDSTNPGQTAVSGSPGTGGGGGAGDYQSYGGAGGSGVIIVAYVYPNPAGLSSTSGVVTTQGGKRYHRFSGAGSSTFTLS